tara:strand:- start:221 stop:1363 length:1143 start_codon:yes stop_codon:yes gene_type:complete
MAEYGVSFNKEKNSNNKSSNGISSLNNIPANKLKVPQKDLLVFFRQLSVILQSGVPLAQGLFLLSENMTNKKFALCIRNIGEQLNAGEELSSSLARYPRIFAPITIGLIEAGEAGGTLDTVLSRIATLMEEQSKIKSQIQGALIYPVLVLVLAVSVSLGLLIFIVPKFKDMFDDLGADLPLLTAFMLNLSKIVTSPLFALLAPLAIFGGVFVFRNYYSTKNGRRTVDNLILKTPLFGALILRTEVASFCDTLFTLVNSGIPIVEGLQRCIGASSNQIIKNTIAKSILLVEEGQELSYSLSLSSTLPKLVISMIKIGEETGKLSFMLENLSNFYKREVDATVSALTKAMEPAIIFVVAGIVGTIVVSLYLPMFSLITEMGQ